MFKMKKIVTFRNNFFFFYLMEMLAKHSYRTFLLTWAVKIK